jgi:hypothetical protein
MAQPTLEDLEKFALQLSDKFLDLAGQVSATIAAVSVLKALVAAQISPDDPAGVLKQLQAVEKNLLDQDASEKTRLETQEQIRVLLQVGKTKSFES